MSFIKKILQPYIIWFLSVCFSCRQLRKIWQLLSGWSLSNCLDLTWVFKDSNVSLDVFGGKIEVSTTKLKYFYYPGSSSPQHFSCECVPEQLHH